jgi:presenilin-like A22 family membrane protease
MQDKKKEVNDILPAVIMGGLFVIIHGLALIVTKPFIDAGVQPVFEDINNPLHIIYIFAILLAFTLFILIIAKFYKKQIIHLVILGAIGYTAAYVMYPLVNLLIPNYSLIRAPMGNNAFFTITLSAIIAIILAILLIIVLYKYPEWYVIDIAGVIIGAGAIAIFGMSLGILLVIIFLIGLAVYDAISVYKTKHMIELADTVMDLKLPVLLVIPKTWGYSLLKETKRLKEQIKEGEERDAFFMGLGDIVMPGILVAATYNNISNGLPISIGVIIGTLIGFAVLMHFVMKGKPQAGLPLLCSGAILGYIISSFIFFGEIKGLIFGF